MCAALGEVDDVVDFGGGVAACAAGVPVTGQCGVPLGWCEGCAAVAPSVTHRCLLAVACVSWLRRSRSMSMAFHAAVSVALSVAA